MSNTTLVGAPRPQITDAPRPSPPPAPLSNRPTALGESSLVVRRAALANVPAYVPPEPETVEAEQGGAIKWILLLLVLIAGSAGFYLFYTGQFGNALPGTSPFPSQAPSQEHLPPLPNGVRRVR